MSAHAKLKKSLKTLRARERQECRPRRITFPTVTRPDGTQFQTHAPLVVVGHEMGGEQFTHIATAFGTFQKDSAGVFRWVRDHRFTLTLPAPPQSPPRPPR